jgi:hypothetical protein
VSDSWTQRWDDRYKTEAFACGELPNNYLKNNWKTKYRGHTFRGKTWLESSAFDISAKEKKKAMLLAAAN